MTRFRKGPPRWLFTVTFYPEDPTMAKTPSHPLRRKTDRRPARVLRDYIATLWHYRLAIAFSACGIALGVAIPVALASLYDVRHGPTALAILGTAALFAVTLIPLSLTQARARDEQRRHHAKLEQLHGLTLEAVSRCNSRVATVLQLLAPDQAKDPDAVRVVGTRDEDGAYAPSFEDVARQMIGRRVSWEAHDAVFPKTPPHTAYGTVTGSHGTYCVVKPDGQSGPIHMAPFQLTLLDEFDQPVLGGAFQAERRRNRGQEAQRGAVAADPNYLLRDG